jgi:hypothetical protein
LAKVPAPALEGNYEDVAGSLYKSSSV